MIVGCVSGFMEEAFIERCLVSLRPHVDRLIFVDGAYQNFPHDKPWSVDKTLIIADRHCDCVLTVRKAWIDEIHKRNSYLMGQPGDWYFVLDADEELVGNLSCLDKEPLGFGIDIHRTMKDGSSLPTMSILRCFRARRGLHYYGAHNALFCDGSLLNKEPRRILGGCFIQHYMDHRDQKRVEAKGEYYRALQKEEHDFRLAARI